MRIGRAALCAALLLFGTSAQAQDVTLTSRDGGVALSGMLLGYDGAFYRVETDFGVLTVDGSGVDCEGPGCPDLQNFVARLTFSGARTMGEVLLPALIEAFALREGYVAERVEEAPTRLTYLLRDGEARLVAEFGIHATTSGEGFADLLAEEADVVLSLRPVRAEEVARGREIGLGQLSDPARSRVLALDAHVPLVAPGNPVAALRIEDLGAVLAGRITNWRELGGQDAPIVLHLRDEGAGAAEAILGAAARQGGALAEGVTFHASGRALAAAVATDPWALGLGTRSAAGDAVALPLTGGCGFHAAATEEALKTEDYPLTAPLYLYLPARRLPVLGREFLAFARSGPAQPVIRRAGFTDHAIEAIPLRMQGERLMNAIRAAGPEIGLADLQALLAALEGAERLSLAFRFDGGSTALDGQSRSNVEVLAAALEAGLYDGRTLIFAGFSDGAGAAELNMRLSARRAEVVRDAVLAAAPTLDPARVTMEAQPFGEAMPLACDDTGWGRDLNRRVEVWLR